jgi:RNA polymerase sigma factor (sigma-70 family)
MGGPFRTVLHYLDKMAGKRRGDGPSDGQLVERFLGGGDEAAFELLVRRYGPLVLGLCRRVLHHEQDAEDVFQATFLLLVRKGASIARRDSVGSWLYGVAYRLATQLKAKAVRRQTFPAGTLAQVVEADAPPGVVWTDLRPVLDEEISQLPSKYRVAFVLCHLEGKTNEEAAAQLGCPTGTVLSRLSRARARLRTRLLRRGVALSAAALAGALAQAPLRADMPASLVGLALRTAPLAAAGPAALAGAVSAPVAALTEGAIRAMRVSKVKLAVAVLLAVAVVGLGAGLMAHRVSADKPEGGPSGAVAARPASRQEADKVAKVDRFGDALPEGAIARMGTARLWSDCVWNYDVAFHSAGKQLVSVGRDRKVRVWDIGTGKELRQFPGFKIVVSPDGKTLAYQGLDGPNPSTKWPVIELATGKTVSTITIAGGAGVTALSPNREILAAAGAWAYESKIRFFRVATGKELAPLDTERGRVSALAFSPDQRALAAANGDKSITLWDVPAGKRARHLPGHRGTVLAVGFSADGATLFSVGEDQTARVWDVARGIERRRFSVSGKRAGFSPGGQRLAVTGSFNTIKCYDVSSGKELWRWRGTPPGHMVGQDGFLTVAFSPDGKKVALGGGERINLHEAATGAEVYPGHTSAVGGALLSPDGRMVATSSSDGVRVWEAATGKQRCHFAGDLYGTQSLMFAADSQTITVLSGGVVHTYELVTGKVTRQFIAAPRPPPDPDLPNFRPAPAGALSATARKIAVATGTGIQLWDAVKGKELRRIELEASARATLRSVTFSPSGRIVAAWHLRRTSRDGRGPWAMWINLWEAKSGKHLWRLRSAGPLVFSPDGKMLASVGDGVIPYVYDRKPADTKLRLWDLTSGKELRQLDTGGPVLLDGFRATVLPTGASFAFSPNGKTLISGGAKGTIRFWNTATGKVIHEIRGPQALVTAVAVAADGKHLVSGGADTTALLWKWPGTVKGPGSE